MSICKGRELYDAIMEWCQNPPAGFTGWVGYAYPSSCAACAAEKIECTSFYIHSNLGQCVNVVIKGKEDLGAFYAEVSE